MIDMKFCLIHSLYYPYAKGGAEVVVEIILNELLAQGHQVILITLGRRKEIQRQGNLMIYRINPFNIFSFLDIDRRPIWLRFIWHPMDVFNISSYFAVKKILKQETPKAVLTHNLKGLGYLIPKAIRRVGLKQIHTIHDVQLSRPSGLIYFGQEKPFLILDKMYEKIVKRLFGNSDVVISPSRWLMGYYQARGFFYESKKIILPNPVIFKKVEKRDETMEQGQGGKITLLYVGQWERHKGILFLVNALKKIKLENWQILIVGNGGAKLNLEKLVGGDLRFKLVGWVEPEKLSDYFRQSDLTLVPSLCYENSPQVINESLVANVPVVAADIGGVSEIVKDNYNGFTFAPGNEKNLIEVLEYFLSHPQFISDLKRNCFVSVRDYSVGHYIKKLLNLI